MSLSIDGVATVIRPGAKLLVRIDPDTCPTLEQASEMQRLLMEELPGVEVLVISCHELAVYEPEEAS